MIEEITLGELTENTRPICYGVLKPGPMKSDGVPLIRVTDISSNYFDDSNLYKISNELDFEFKRSRLNGGELLLSIQGTIGKVVICPLKYAGSNISRTIAVIDPDERLNKNYLRYYFIYMDSSKKHYSTGSTRASLNIAYLRKLKIPLPPLDTQKKIAAILDEADKLRQLDKKLIEKYDALTQSLFLDMFGDPVINPKGWKKIIFGNYITVLTDYHSNGSYETLRQHVTLKNEPDYALMVRTTDLENNNFDDGVNYIDEHAYKYLEKSKVFGGEIIINKIGSAGKVYRMPFLNRPVSLGMNAFLLRFNDSINQEFLYFQLISKYGEREIQKRVKGAVTKTIRKDAVREIPIVSPPIELQNQFAEHVQTIEAQKAQAQQSLQKSEELFNSLLQKAFKGELV